MADRTVSVRLQAVTGGFNSQLALAATHVKGLKSELATVGGLAAKQSKGFDELGKIGLAAGAGIAAGAAMAVKAAVSYESAFAGVRKTVDATESEFAALSDGIRDMSKRMPASATEIAGVAEAAGQLGIQKGAILDFSETMIMLASTTNLTADQAAVSMAQIANVMGTAPADIDRMGAALVALGNAGASTEAEIISMAQRLAGAGKLVGASEADILALANAMASMGIEAELGGGAMSRTILDIEKAAAGGADSIAGFADVAGLSAQKFASLWEADPIRAVDAFVQGLSRIEEGGGSAITALDDLGIKGTQDLQVLLRLKGAQDLLSDSLDLGAESWSANTALTDEYGERLKTTEAQMEILKNQVVDAAISFGTDLLPAVRFAVDALGDFVGGVDRVLDVLGPFGPALAGLSATVLIAGGGFLLLAPRIAATKDALRVLGVHTPITSGHLTTLGKVAGGAAIGLAAIAVAGEWARSSADVPGVDSLTRSLLDLNETGRLSGEMLEIVGEDYKDLGHKMGQATKGMADMLNPFGGAGGWAEVEEYKQQIDALDKSLASLYARDPQLAKARFEELAQAAVSQGKSLDEVVDIFNDYGEAVAAGEVSQKLTEEGAPRLAAGIDGVGDAAGGAVGPVEELTEAQKAMATAIGSFTEPLSIYQEHVRETATAVADATADAGDSWEDYVDDASMSLSDFEAHLQKQIDDQAEWERNLAEIARRGRVDVALELAKMGPEGAALVAEFANATEPEMHRAGDLLVQAARDGGEGAGKALEDQLNVMAIIGRTGGKATAKAIAEELQLSVEEVLRITSGYGVAIASGVNPVLAGIGKPTLPTINGVRGPWNPVKVAVSPQADGGFENHVAQIAPGGAMRLWAEPETGGEAYIPLLAKRRQEEDVDQAESVDEDRDLVAA